MIYVLTDYKVDHLTTCTFVQARKKKKANQWYDYIPSEPDTDLFEVTKILSLEL